MLSFQGHPGPGAPLGAQYQASLPSAGGQWQSDADMEMREQVTRQIFTIFSNRKGGGNSNRLPDFVKRLEEGLYRSARTKEDYLDSNTLETRLQEVARRFVSKQQGQAQPQQAPAPQRQMFPMQGQSAMPMGSQYPHAMPPHQAPGPGPGSNSGFVPTPMNGGALGMDQMAMSAQRNVGLQNGNNISPSPGMSSPELVGPQSGPMGIPGMVPNSVFGSSNHNINGSTVMPNGAPVMIKAPPLQSYMNAPNNVPSMGMSGVMNGSVQPGGGMPNPSNPFVPISSTGVTPMPMPMPGGTGMVPVNNGMMHQHSQPPVGPMMVNSMAAHQQTAPQQAGNMVPVSQPNNQSSYAAATGASGQSMQSGLPGPDDQTQVTKKQRWLLFLRHCAKCRQNEQECSLKAQCKFGKQLWHHILHCSNPVCDFPRCGNSKELLKHHQKCQDPQCAICVPVKDYVKRTRLSAATQGPAPTSSMMAHAGNMGGGLTSAASMPLGMVPNPGMMAPGAQVPTNYSAPLPQQRQAPMQPPPAPPLMGTVPGASTLSGQKRSHDAFGGFGGGAAAQSAAGFQGGQVPGMLGTESQEPKKMRVDKHQLITKNTGTSLLETFSADQIRTHIDSLYQAAAQTRAATPQPPDSCKVCGVSRLIFEPPVIYCNGCGMKIKRSQVYYCTPANNNSDIKGSWCHGCYTDQKSDRILLEGSNFKKGDLEKKKNDFESDEHWVQCDVCEGWVHQICGLFNKGRNTQEVPYLCPGCLLEGLQTQQRQRIEVRPQAMLDAKELPHNQLSKYLEHYMGHAIEQERTARAKALGVMPHQVAGAEGLAVRVINSVIKKCETKQRFVDTFTNAEGYPTEFPFKQRVIVLFQNLDGVDVCLFVMYVQEYGANCPKPNTNCVYLSYLDSVKYFRPESVMAHGCPNPNTSLRTFVYHQLQVAYLDYVKRLGFEQMYIWACPPMQGDDYILYCHPAKQKTPRSDRLRSWYHDMLKDARNRGIVKHLSTLWDTYFEGGKDHRLERCSATHMPYLEGDYWPGEAENLLMNIEASNKGGKKDAGSAAPGGAARKHSSKGKRYGSGPATTDEQLMSRLGEILGGNMKEDFIVVHLKEVCTFCRTHVESGLVYKYHSNQPLKSQAVRTFEGVKIEAGPNVPSGPINSLCLCENCFQDEQRRVAERSSHVRLPQGIAPDKLECVQLAPEPTLTDADPDIECEHFETRQSFLNLCQGNYYQFDTIRRAKHSSMMVLYHLHNPEAPAFTTTCNVCSCEIESGTGFKCTVCPDFDMCAACRQSTGHPHPLTMHTKRLDETRVRLTEQERRERNEQLQKTMTLLVHACSCNDPNCASSSCKKVRLLFRHAMECATKVTGGCQMCKKMWCLLNLHAKSCTQPDCAVPRCRELKELRRRQAARQEDQRRKAYQAMLRNQMGSQS